MNKEQLEAVAAAEKKLADKFEKIDRISTYNTEKVLRAFWKEQVSEPMLHGTTGYGYDDRGRDALDRVFAEVFGAEDALVRHNFISGTHVIATALYAVLRPGDTLYAVTGDPYDTLLETIGVYSTSENPGSLADFGIKYRKTELKKDGTPELDEITKILS